MTTTRLYVSTTGTSGAADTSCATAAYTTPQDAINAAAAGDIIMICAGTYPGGFNIPSGLDGLTLEGARHGVDARMANNNPETVITSSASNAGIGVNSNRVTIDGFTLSGDNLPNSGPGWGYAIEVPGTVSGTQILNNIVSNNIVGIYLNNGGTTPAAALVQHNLFSHNDQSGPVSGTGIYTDAGSSNVTIDSNAFFGNNNAGIIYSGSLGSQSNERITNNTFTGNSAVGGTAVALYSVSNATISGNTVNGTGPSNQNNDAVYLGGGDSGITLDSNTFQSSGGWALDIHNDISSANSSITAQDNQFDTGNALGGVSVASGAYTSGSQVAATENWWGDASGPGAVASGSGAKVSSGVDFSHWTVTPDFPSVPAAPSGVTATAPSSSVDQADVSWTAPATDGGSAVTGYQVVPFDQTTNTAGNAQNASGSATSAAVTGLTAGDSYTFTVTAGNSAGNSTPSAASNAAVPLGVAATQSNSGTSSTPGGSSTASTGTSGAPGSVSGTASGGEGTLTISTYSSDPGAGFQAGASYFDVSVSPGSTFNKVTFQVCGVASGETVKWYDPINRTYSPVSEQTAPSGSNRCVTVTVTPSTSPSISQMSGTVFAVAQQGGYWLAAADGGVFTDGVPYFGSMGGTHLNAPVVGIAADPQTGGYWLVAKDGGVFAFNAPFFGSMGGTHLNAPIVGIAAAPGGGGYSLVAADGGVFTFGNAKFFGSTGATRLNAPMVGITPTASGNGYWLIASDGGVFTFGDAKYFGSMGSTHLNAPMVGIASDPQTGGYWLVAKDGGVFTFNAPFLGSMGGTHLNAPVAGMQYSSHDGGYRLVGADGGVFDFHAGYFGSQGGTHLNAPIVGISNI